MIITYTMTAALLLICLLLMLTDTSVKLRGNEHRRISTILICTTMFYVLMDFLWIREYLTEDYSRGRFTLVNFLFYLVYITLPYMWFLFARHFAGYSIRFRGRTLLYGIPWAINLVLVIITMFGTGTLWSIGDAESRYARGPLFGLFSDLNLIYYFIPIIGIIILLIKGSGSGKASNSASPEGSGGKVPIDGGYRRTLLITLGFSAIPAIGVGVNTFVIPVDAIYPFQPCCFFVGVMFAYMLFVSQVYLAQQRLGDQQSKMITALAADFWSVYYIELDTDHGICYQSHSDLEDSVRTGDEFSFIGTFTNYAGKYVAEQYRDEFISFIQPDSIRRGLESERVVSYRYMVHRNGRDTYEMVRFAGVRRPEDRDDHIVHAVSACFTDVDAETRRSMEQNIALSDALTAAEEASKAKTAFLSNMSHEIRTPMNAIIGLNNIAMNDPETPEKTLEYLDKIGTSARHLLNIINDILDMSRIESGRMVIRNEEFSFSKALEQINTIINGQCRDKDLHYECRIKGGIGEYYVGDEMKLRQVMINILGNAVKFTPAGGDITFTIEEVAKFDGKATLRFTMADNGIGMSEEYLPHLFDAFTQEDDSATNKYGSTGLGMPITKSIVELMNGHIEVESTKGEGTTFTVTITLAESDRSDAEADAGELRPHEMSVLVIDDDPIACEHADIVLGQVGISCETAGSGAEGIEMIKVRHARRHPYDLILVDWKMPEMDGIETTRRIRSIAGHDSAIIILTSYNWDDIADEAKVAGVDSFVPKPLFAGSVLDEFREAFRQKNQALLTSKADLTGRRILLAEDMPVNAEIMVMVLSMREMEVDLAENGRIAVDMYSSHPEGYYDAVLMDMRMPEMDGLEATRTIRAMGRADSGRIPIIALTANAFDEDVQRSMQAGLNAHLSKPVEPEALFETLESLIEE